MRDSSFERKGGSRQLSATCRPASAFSVLCRGNDARMRSNHRRLRIHSQPTQRARAVIRWELRDLALSRLGTPPEYVDSQLLHPRLQRRSLDSETGGRALRSGDDPVRLLERGNNPLPLGVIERGASVPTLACLSWVRASRHRKIFPQHPQNLILRAAPAPST